MQQQDAHRTLRPQRSRDAHEQTRRLQQQASDAAPPELGPEIDGMRAHTCAGGKIGQVRQQYDVMSPSDECVEQINVGVLRPTSLMRGLHERYAGRTFDCDLTWTRDLTLAAHRLRVTQQSGWRRL